MNSAFITSELTRFQAGALFFCIRDERDFEMLKQVLTDLKGFIRKRAVHAFGVCDLEDSASYDALVQMGAAVFPLSTEWEDLEKKFASTCEILKSQYPDSVQENLPLTRELKTSMRAPNTGNHRE